MQQHKPDTDFLPFAGEARRRLVVVYTRKDDEESKNDEESKDNENSKDKEESKGKKKPERKTGRRMGGRRKSSKRLSNQLATVIGAQNMRSILLVALALILQACAMAPSAFLTQAKLTSHDVMATDSRLRVIAETEQGVFSTTGIVEPKRILCTEPSPDVATTLANSLGVGISIFGYGSGSLSTQQVEGLVQLGERTAAIQLFRDKMYQTCLAYANGAISGTSYSLIMNRLDDAIVTLSLGDGAAGAFGRKLAGIGGEASAKAEAAVTGLPSQISKIEEQSGKLAAANKRVDDAEKTLQAQKSTQPAAGKEEEYKAQTKKLEEDLAAAKANRDALLELMRSTAKSASEASGKISQIEVGGGLTPRPDASALREMQADFLLSDVNRDFIAACVVELGLRDPGQQKGKDNLQTLIDQLKEEFSKTSSRLATYAGAILRGQGTALAEFCKRNLKDIFTNATTNFQAYRLKRAQLNADVATARYAGDAARASARDRELFMESIKLCNTEFKNDDARKKACLDQVIPIKSNGAAGQPQPAEKRQAKQEQQPGKQPQAAKRQSTKAQQTKKRL